MTRIDAYAVLDMGPGSKTLIRHLRPNAGASLRVSYPDGRGGAAEVCLHADEHGNWQLTIRNPDSSQRAGTRGNLEGIHMPAGVGTAAIAASAIQES